MHQTENFTTLQLYNSADRVGCLRTRTKVSDGAPSDVNTSLVGSTYPE